MINKESNYDKTKSVIIGIFIFILMLIVVEYLIELFVINYLPKSSINWDNVIYSFISPICVFLSFSLSTYFFSKGKVKEFAKFTVKFFGVSFIIGIIFLFLWIFFKREIPSMGGYTIVVLLLFLENIFEKLDK
ncbi:conserved membrane protein of unknown function [Methanocaldococcus lauensis]|uniref:Uncharacterized protein n=1 Tax=Methanocaldococcus lauensis TaxID=2546128 RepID=A0A8D6SVW0_9EURY|nr:hypothetical protein [Methanocaldococcus lauensis]CAB3288804.1 conserved membrane protein of unknown function [Methanocaldococcus lauensis]